ncbi:MAG: hypothetical protein EOO89_24410, partial [Pedobacter sp.]
MVPINEYVHLLALFLSAYRPSDVLKGAINAGTKGIWIRRGLVGVQFIVSISFIIGILVINYQMTYLEKRDKGFSATGLINMNTSIGGKRN